MNLSKLQRLVYKVIQDNPGVQNDDAKLVAAVWRTEGWNDSRSLEDNIKRVTRSESITRRRRELHEAGLITYSGEAMKARTEAYKKEQNAHSYHEETVAAIVQPKYIMQIIDGERVMVQA